VELVDTHALGACAYSVGVQVLSSAPEKRRDFIPSLFIL